MKYKQCLLKKDNVSLTTWIPEKLAKEGKTLRRKIDDIWIDGWIIEEVYSVQKEENEAIDDSTDYKHQREASDI